MNTAGMSGIANQTDTGGCEMSIDTLQAKIRKLKNPTMVCICPSYEQLPPRVREAARAEYGDTLRALKPPAFPRWARTAWP